MPIEIMDKREKRKFSIISWVPMIAWVLVLGYHMLLLRPQIARQNMEDHDGMHTQMAQDFDTLMILYGAAGVITLVVLLIFIVHLLKIRHMTMGNKLAWSVVLAAFVPVSFPIFWYSIIRREPKHLEVNNTIEGE